jgi:hypothetical protein
MAAVEHMRAMGYGVLICFLSGGERLNCVVMGDNGCVNVL